MPTSFNGSLVIREQNGRVFYEAKWRDYGPGQRMTGRFPDVRDRLPGEDPARARRLKAGRV